MSVWRVTPKDGDLAMKRHSFAIRATDHKDS